MDSSLKSQIPRLARLMQTTPAALYERQRGLVRDGLLPSEEGRGPGSGVRTTPSSVALLILAALASENLRKSTSRAADLGNALPVDAPHCPLTRRTNFGTALLYLLGATGVAAAVIDIEVSRTAMRARIRYHDDAGEIAVSRFGVPEASEPALRVIAVLSGDGFKEIANTVQGIVLEGFNGEGQ